MAALKILTFNWHEAYICLLAKTHNKFTVVDKNKGGYAGWLHQTRPVPSNVNLLPIGSEAIAVARAKENEFDLAICHNLRDLADLAQVPLPKIVLFHNMISTEIALFTLGGRPALEKDAYVSQFLSLFDDKTRAVFISDKKRADAAEVEGSVILPGIDLDDYGGYRGTRPRVLRVGNFFTGRDIMLGQTKAAAAVRDLPVTILGINPEIPAARLSASWDDLKEHFRSHRVYLNTTIDGYEDGYNLSMLEAMATGMPVVSTCNESSPIEDGVNGFTSNDSETLHNRLQRFMKDRALAQKFGARARETIAEKFSLACFIGSWNRIFDEAVQGCSAQSHRATRTSQKAIVPPLKPEIQSLIDERAWSRVRPVLENRVQEFPNSCADWLRLGTAYLGVGREPEATRAFWAACRIDPDDALARRLHLESLAGSLMTHPENNPEAAALRVVCSGKGIDVGCGGSKTHPSAIGVDLLAAGAVGTEGGISGCKSTADICASGDHLPMFSDGELDYVVSRHNLEHYQDPVKALEEWKRVLRSGGLLGLVLPDDTETDTIHLDSTHKHVFTPASLCRLMHYLGGFDVLHTGVCLLRWSFTAIFQKHGAGISPFDYRRALDLEAAERSSRAAEEREKKGDPAGALECWREAAVLDPGDVSKLHAQVRVIRRSGHVKEAEEILLELARRFPDDVEYHTWHPAVALDANGSITGRSSRPFPRELPVPSPRKRILLSYCSMPHTTAIYMDRALRKRHEIVTWGPAIDDEVVKLWNLEAVRDRIVPTDLGYDTPALPEVVRRLAPAWKPDLFLWIESGVDFAIEGLEQLECPKACYLIDTHIQLRNDDRVDTHLKWAQQFDIIFLAQRAYVERFRAAGLNAHWLPLGCDPEIHHEQILPRIYPIAFVGSLNQQRRVGLLNKLRSHYPVHVERCFLEDMARVFSQAGIVFNNAVNNDLNMRVFEAMASGALLLTDPAQGSGLEELFTDGKHLAVYRDDDAVADVAARWLRDDRVRERVARAGQTEVLARHTYEHRVALLEEVVFERSVKSLKQPRKQKTVMTSADVCAHARALLTSNSHGERDPHREANLGRGRILIAAGEWDRARELFLQWAIEAPQNSYPALGLGCIALVQGDWDRAEHHFRKALDLRPEDPKALCALGMVLCYVGRESEATDLLLRGVAQDPTLLPALRALIRAAGSVGRHAEARDAVKSSLALQPANPHLLFSCAALSACLGETTEALGVLDQLESVQPEYPDLARWRAAWAGSSADCGLGIAD